MTRDQIIEKGLAEVGVRETPENDVKYNTWYYGHSVNGSAYPWCAVFMSWLFDGTGVDFPKTATCVEIYNYAKSHGKLVTGNYQVGDVFIYCWNGGNSYDHTGLVTEVNGGSYTVLEGNCSDMVKTITRNSSCVVGAYRPSYGTTSSTTSNKASAATTTVAKTATTSSDLIIPADTQSIGVAAIQGMLKYLGYNLGRCGVDGDSGPAGSYTNIAVKEAISAGKLTSTTVKSLLSITK